MPSIGNSSFPCRSHYFIIDGGVRWAGTYTDEMIALARERDNPRAHVRKPTFWDRAADWLERILLGKKP